MSSWGLSDAHCGTARYSTVMLLSCRLCTCHALFARPEAGHGAQSACHLRSRISRKMQPHVGMGRGRTECLGATDMVAAWAHDCNLLPFVFMRNYVNLLLEIPKEETDSIAMEVPNTEQECVRAGA